MKKLSRREALIAGAMGMGSLPLRSLVTGLPVPFLLGLNNPALAQSTDMKYLVISQQDAGDPVNANSPGTYEFGAIDHPDADGFRTPTTFNLGSQSVRAAQPWADLPAGLRSRMAFWNHSTFANAHPDFPGVRRFNGAMKGVDGEGTDEMSSMIAQETQASLGTTLTESVTVGGDSVFFGGRGLPKFKPNEIKGLFSSNINNLDRMIQMRDNTIDDTYRQIKNNGTPAQKRFLDAYAKGRQEAITLGDSLGALISGIQGNDEVAQAQMAVALIQLNVTPVVTMGLNFGRDNHGDNDLADEVDQTTSAMTAIRAFWNGINAAGLDDRVIFASLNTFGRTLKRNGAGGRDHNGNHHHMFVFGQGIKGGIVGGMEAKAGDFSATGINASTGKSNNADIPFEETLPAVGKTLAKAVGIPNGRINTRINGGKIITGALS